MIPRSFVDELLARTDIVELVGQYVPLKKGGANFSGLCPFHKEKSPSFSVSPSKQFFHCFGCGRSGNALGFLIEHLGLSFPEAVETLALKAGLTVPREASPESTQAYNEARAKHASVVDVLTEVMHFYRSRLKDSPRAVEYLRRRGLSGEVARKFRLGYAPDAWQSLQSVFADYGQNEKLLEAGLVIDSEGGRRYDRFRDRVMFPIRNLKGEVIAFGGRVLDKGDPKYLNSPETATFSKGHELYGLWEAREAIRAEKSVLVVEGYMDVIALAQSGVGHVVATLGTATGPEHLRVLLRLTDRVVFSFDGDAAGRRAARRALEGALPFATDTRRIDFLFLPPDDDPDSYVRREGVEGFRERLAEAMPLSAFLLQEVRLSDDLTIPEGRARAAALAKPWLQALPVGVLRQQLIREVGILTGQISPPSPNANSYHAYRRDDRPPFKGKGAFGKGVMTPTSPARLVRPATLGERLLRCLMAQPQLSVNIDSDTMALVEPRLQPLLRWICEQPRGLTHADLAGRLAEMGAGDAAEGVPLPELWRRLDQGVAVSEVLGDAEDDEGALNELQAAIRQLKIRQLKAERAALVRRHSSDARALKAALEVLDEQVQRVLGGDSAAGDESVTLG